MDDNNFGAHTRGDEIVKIYGHCVLGRTFLITGPSANGIGAQTAIFLAAAKPALLILAGRSLAKIQPVIDQIDREHPDVTAKFVELDLADLASVRRAAAAVKSLAPRLDVLINNAGKTVKDYATSRDGIELTFATNHIGHFLLTNLLMPEILAAGPHARVVNVSSTGYVLGGVHFGDPGFNYGKEYEGFQAYGQSKTANILFAQGLADRLSGHVSAFALCPGYVPETQIAGGADEELVNDGIARLREAFEKGEVPELVPKSLAAGAATSLWAALAPALEGRSGAFLSDCTVLDEPLMPHAVGKKNVDRLWRLSEELVGQKFEYEI